MREISIVFSTGQQQTLVGQDFTSFVAQWEHAKLSGKPTILRATNVDIVEQLPGDETQTTTYPSVRFTTDNIIQIRSDR